MRCKPLCTWPRKKLSTLSMLNCCINWNLHSLRVMIIKKQQSIKLAVQQAQSNFLVHRIPPSIMIQLQRVYLERWSLYSIDPGSKCALLASFEYSVNASPLRLSLILHHDALCDLVISAAIPPGPMVIRHVSFAGRRFQVHRRSIFFFLNNTSNAMLMSSCKKETLMLKPIRGIII